MNSLPDSANTVPFRLLVERGADGIALLRADGTITYASPAALQILGYAPQDLVGRLAADWIHPEDQDRGRHLLGRVLKDPDRPQMALLRCRPKAGGWRWIEAVATNLLGELAVQGVLVNYRDITARRRAEAECAERMGHEQAQLLEQVRRGRARAQALAQRLLEAQEAERRRLAHELHDEIGQALTAVKMNLRAVHGLTREAVAVPGLDESVAIVDRALQQVRSLSLDLRPSLLDDLGLVAALRWYLDRQAQRAGFVAEFVADPPGLRALPAVETACFRVAQEALTNVVRHARAGRVRIELSQRGDELHLSVQDDGVGFEVGAARQRAARGGSLGLLGMQERVLLTGGQIEIRSTPGTGAEVRARLPVASAPSLERRRTRREAP